MSEASAGGAEGFRSSIPRPAPGEHHDFYSGYVSLVPEGDDVLRVLQEGIAQTRAVLDGVPPEAEGYRYAPGKWTIRQVVRHLVDTERIFAYRALHIARGAAAPLPGMDQEAWARESNAGQRPLSDLLDELEAVRRAGLHLFRSFSPEILARRGTASGYEFTVRSFAWITAGHEIHHRGLLRDRYLPGLREGGEEA